MIGWTWPARIPHYSLESSSLSSLPPLCTRLLTAWHWEWEVRLMPSWLDWLQLFGLESPGAIRLHHGGVRGESRERDWVGCDLIFYKFTNDLLTSPALSHRSDLSPHQDCSLRLPLSCTANTSARFYLCQNSICLVKRDNFLGIICCKESCFIKIRSLWLHYSCS